MTPHTPRRLVRSVLAVAMVAVALAATGGAAAGTGAATPAATSAIDIDQLGRPAVGNGHACGISEDRDVYCWGANADGQLGTGTTATSLLPVAVAVAGTPLDGKDVERLAAGRNHTCALTTDDVIACWGDNSNGQLGNGSGTDSSVPVAVTETGTVLDGADIVEISSLHDHTCARTAAGTAACWGLGSVGQLANGSVGDQPTPTDVVTAGTPLASTTIAQVSAGAFNTCFVGADGSVACAGSAFQNALGNATVGNALKPESPTITGTVLDGKSVDFVTAGRYHTCVTTTDDVLACWGIGAQGQQGDGGTTNNTEPTAVTTAGTPIASSPVVAMDSGWDHTCARTAAGAVACWGDNGAFAAGGPTGTDNLVPTALAVTGTVLDSVAVTEIASGVVANCAHGATRQPGCWGTGYVRGDGTNTNSPTPSTVILTYSEPTTAPTITGLTGAAGEIEVTWDGPAGTGGLPITSTRVRWYQGASLINSGTFGVIDGAGGGNAVFVVDPGTYTVTVAAINAAGEGPESAASGPVIVTDPPPEPQPYTAITPCRIVDTRQVGGRFGDREIRDYQVTGFGTIFEDLQGGLPDGCGIPYGATAVEASITAVDPLGSGFFRAWPTGESMPNATFMNFDAGMDITNTGSITIAIGDAQGAETNGGGGGELRVRNFGGSSHYVIDIQGYFGGNRLTLNGSTPEATTSVVEQESLYQPMTPCRIVDTRQAGGALTNREIRDITVIGDGNEFADQGGLAGGCGIPANTVAIEASITAVDPADSGFFRAWPSGESMPNATFMNFDRGMDITNTGAVTISNDDETEHLRIRNFGGTSHYVIDIQGVYLTDPVASEGEAATAAVDPGISAYVAITPCRIVDTRQAGGALTNREIRDITVIGDGNEFADQGGLAGGCDIPADASAVEASITAVDPADSGFFRAWPTGESMPNATFMNFDRGMDITNTGALTINPDQPKHLRIRNFGGTSHYVIDIQGYFLPLDLMD